MVGKGGRTPARNASLRPCEVCGKTFQPYRLTGTTCSAVCYKRLPRVKIASAEIKARPAAKERRNSSRRIGVHPERREVNLRSQLRSRYGLTLEEYQRRADGQGGGCILCGHIPSGVRAASRLHVDHDHETGAIRDLLCTTCNQGIGFFKDSPDLLRAAADYIDRHRRY